MEWNKIDLHIHAEHGLTHDGKNNSNGENYYSLSNMLIRNKAHDLKLVSLTEHNKIDIINNIKLRYALETYGQSTTLPGVELDIIIKEKRYHVIVIFSNKVNLVDINFKLVNYIKKKDNKIFFDLDEFISIIEETECIVIPHGCKKQGFKQEQKDSVDSDIAITLVDILRSRHYINLLFEHTKPHFKGSFAKNIIQNSAINWLTIEEMENVKKRLSAGIKGSDFRFTEKIYIPKEEDFTAIWATPSFRGLELACIFPENRISMFSQVIEKSDYISKIKIKENENFEESSINLSSGLNSIIGRSAAGKTTLLHLIASKLSGDKINQNQYSFTENLEVDFFDKDNNPINMLDIKIEVSDNLYEKIAMIHKSDISEILNLFDYKINKNSPTLDEYENKINDFSKVNKEYLEKSNLVKENYNSFTENIRNYLMNFKSTSKNIINYTIQKGPYGKLTNDMNEFIKIQNKFYEFRNQVESLNETYKEIQYFFVRFSIKNKFNDIIESLEKELIEVRQQLNIKLFTLKKQLLIHRKLNQLIDLLNKNIGQKSEYIQRLLNNIVNSKDSLIYNLKRKIILSKREKTYNLDFPFEKLRNELTESNKNDYIDLEIIQNDLMYEVKADNGIIDYYRNSSVLQRYKQKVINKSNDIKDMIKEINISGNIPRFRKNDILETLIEESKIKLGYPGKEKIYIQNVSPGDASKIYIDYKFKNDFKKGTFNVVLFDQPENDLDKEFIYNDLLPQINKLKNEVQVILTSHDPLVVVNGDSNVVITASKIKNKIKYVSSNLEDYIEDEPITSLISKFVDGHEEAVKERYEIYTGGNKW